MPQRKWKEKRNGFWGKRAETAVKNASCLEKRAEMCYNQLSLRALFR